MNKFVKLFVSLTIDGIGFLAYGATEMGDLIWAPLSALAIGFLYHRDFYTFLGFTEEIFPGTDIIPTATIAWMDEQGFLEFLKKR